MIKEYRTVESISDTSVYVSLVRDVGLGESAKIIMPNGGVRHGIVTEADANGVKVLVLEGTSGMDCESVKVSFDGKSPMLSVSPDMLGRTFDGLGRASDAGFEIIPCEKRNIFGADEPMLSRSRERKAFDNAESARIYQGQSLALISKKRDVGIDTALKLAQRYAEELCGDIAIVFAGIGMSYGEEERVTSKLRTSGLAPKTVSFINRPNDPMGERLLVPDMALTAAEYLAFELGRRVLVVISDLSAYAEARKCIFFSDRANALNLEKRTLDGVFADEITSAFTRIFDRVDEKNGIEGSISLVSVSTACDSGALTDKSVFGCADNTVKL